MAFPQKSTPPTLVTYAIEDAKNQKWARKIKKKIDFCGIRQRNETTTDANHD
jgi:hypothetical protein